jgi:impB/mucB/samB family
LVEAALCPRLDNGHARSLYVPVVENLVNQSSIQGELSVSTILHADLDAFYASVEQLLDPRLRDKPIAVGSGVVLAASYEAKVLGVRGGMPGRRARQLCPHLIFVSGHFKDYQRLGDAAIKVINDFTPLVERISIDEAFADVVGCTHLFGPPAEIAKSIRRRVRTELGLPISVGVARTKHLAKIASQVAKPDGLVVVDPETELDFLHDLPVELMWGEALPQKRDWPRRECSLSDSWPRPRRSRCSGCLAERLGKSWCRSHGIAIHGKSRRIGARNRPERNQRSAGSPRWSVSSDRRFVISPTGSAVASGPDLVLVGR